MDALARIERKCLAGETLSESEILARNARLEATHAEEAARAAFARFYAQLPAENADAALSPEVARAITCWTDTRKRFDDAIAALIAEALPTRQTPRRGPRLKVSTPETVPIPTPASARDALALLFSPNSWHMSPGGDALIAETKQTQVRVELDAALGFGAESAVERITRHGASAAQTFLSLAAFWKAQCGEASPETYLTVYASDLLRFQGRKETPKGGYHRDDLLAKGRDLFFLSRLSVPTRTVHTDVDGRTTTTTALNRLLSLETLESVVTDGGGQPTTSIVRFRYHLGREVHAWLLDSRRSTPVSSKLLSYHPQRQKYQILLGFCLACLNAEPRETKIQIPLPSLLRLAGIDLPTSRTAAFLTTLEDAFADLARDGVVPGVKVIKPVGWHESLASRRATDVLQGTRIEIPLALPEAVQ